MAVATVEVTGRVVDVSGNPPGGHLRVFAAPAVRNLSAVGMVTSSSVEAVVNQETGEWSMNLIPSSDIKSGYRFRAWWVGSNPGSEVWAEMGNGRWIDEDGAVVDTPLPDATVYMSATAPDPDVDATYQMNTTTGDLFERSA